MSTMTITIERTPRTLQFAGQSLQVQHLCALPVQGMEQAGFAAAGAVRYLENGSPVPAPCGAAC